MRSRGSSGNATVVDRLLAVWIEAVDEIVEVAHREQAYACPGDCCSGSRWSTCGACRAANVARWGYAQSAADPADPARVGVFAVGVVNAVSGVASSLNTVGGAMAHPGESTSQLEPGGYVVYESAGITDATSARVTIDPDSITVSGPAGAVPVVCISCGSTKTTVTLGDATYVGVVSFTADTAGSYTVAATDSVPLSCSVRRCHRPWWARSAASGWPCSEGSSQSSEWSG